MRIAQPARCPFRHRLAAPSVSGSREGIGSIADGTLRSVRNRDRGLQQLRRARGEDAPTGLPPRSFLSEVLPGLRGECCASPASATGAAARRAGGQAQPDAGTGAGHIAVSRRRLGASSGRSVGPRPRPAQGTSAMGSTATALVPIGIDSDLGSVLSQTGKMPFVTKVPIRSSRRKRTSRSKTHKSIAAVQIQCFTLLERLILKQR